MGLPALPGLIATRLLPILRSWLRPLGCLALCCWVALSWGSPADALQLPWGRHAAQQTPALPISGPSGRLQEVAAPGGVQQLRRQLDAHRPQLHLDSPGDGEVMTDAPWTLILRVEDWPVSSDPDLGPGPHVALQVDAEPPRRFTQLNDGRIQVALPALSPGSHRLSAYAAYPWGEAVKRPGASIQWRLHQLQSLPNTQPGPDDPWLVLVSPSELSEGEPLLLDWLVWNAPLQNLRAGDARWRLRLSINGDSVLVDQQDALWLRGLKQGTQAVQMELLDGIGEPIAPVFNNQLRAVPQRRGPGPAWMRERLSEEEIARLLGRRQPDDQPAESEPEPEPEPESEPEPEPESEPEPEPESEPAPEAPAESEADASVEPQLPTRTEPPPLSPTTSLGGSARELLNPDGTQR
jgi:hypothetical protein